MTTSNDELMNNVELRRQLSILKNVLGEARYDRILQIPVKKRIEAVHIELANCLQFPKCLVNYVYEYMQFNQISLSNEIQEDMRGLDYICKTKLSVEKVPRPKIDKVIEVHEDGIFLLDQKIDKCYFQYKLYHNIGFKRDNTYYNIVYQDRVTGFYIFVDMLEFYHYGTNYPVKDFYCYTSIEELLEAHENHVLGTRENFGDKIRQLHGI